jgi:hexosaminidase
MRRAAVVLLALLGALTACAPVENGTAMTTTVIPAPVSQTDGEGAFTLGRDTVIGGEGEAAAVAEYFAQSLRPATGYDLPVGTSGEIQLVIGASPAPGGYTLDVEPGGIRIEADAPAGLFAGVQTLRQLLPPAAFGREPAEVDWSVASTRIEDHPRFEYRGAMLDVARHFFAVADVKKYIDDIAMLKLNYLHLHLTDDQGWRLQILSRPELTEIGASTQVDGGGGGYYTQDEYREIVEFAASRFITIVPEIDMPGHTNAALSAYPELNCDGIAPQPYEGIEVGFSSLCIGKEETYAFLEDVIGEVAALTPGPFLHLGGDESLATSDEDFLTFIARATAIGARSGKTIIGWHEMGRSAELPAGTIGQYWSFVRPQGGTAEHTLSFVEQGGRVILSPADVAYLDMKYDPTTDQGLVWANGPTSVTESYLWEPAEVIRGLSEEHILGVEAPIWTETLRTIGELEYFAFPRIVSIAELAWSAQNPGTAGARFDDFGARLASLQPRLEAEGITYYKAPDVPWRD